MSEEALKAFAKRMRRLAYRTFVVLFVLIGVLIVALLNNDNLASKAERRARCGDEIQAFTYAQEFVERRLKTPKTAQFEPFNFQAVGEVECGKWRVNSYVDAKNSFNATIRTHFTATVRLVDKGVWELDQLSLK